MSRLLLLSGLIVLGVGCASSQSASRAGGPALSLGHAGGEPLRVEGSAITGPSSSLALSDHGMRGRFHDQPVALTWTWQELTGSVAGRGTRMELAEGDDTRLWGSFGGLPVDITLEKDWLYGYVGGCGYVLQHNEAGFVGERSCGDSLESIIQLDFPAPLLERPLGERAALMTLMLVDFTRPAASALSMARFVRPRTALDAPAH